MVRSAAVLLALVAVSASEISSSGSGSASPSGSSSQSSASGSGSGHGSGAAYYVLGNQSEVEAWCTSRRYADLLAYVISVAPDERPHETIIDNCNDICISPSSSDYERECKAHSHHTRYSVWQEALVDQPSLQWNVFFVCFSLLSGAVLMKFLPPQVRLRSRGTQTSA